MSRGTDKTVARELSTGETPPKFPILIKKVAMRIVVESL